MKPDPMTELADKLLHRALNDYTANKTNQPTKFVEPKKTATCISSYSPGMKINLETKQQGREAK